MKTLIRTFFIVLSVVGLPLSAAEPSITVEELLKGSKVPLRREFPLSGKVKPCEDFHRYVCEKAETDFKLPKDRSVWYFSFSDSGERMLHIRKAYFKKLAAGLEPKLARTKNVTRLYKACMDVEASKKSEEKFVKANMEKILAAKDLAALRGLLNSWLLTPQQLFLGFYEVANQDNPERNDVTLSTGAMSLPERSYYLEKQPPKDLRGLALAFFNELKFDKAGERADAVVEFETNFAKIHPLPEELRKLFSENTYETRDKLISLYPNFDLKRVFKDIPEKVLVRNITKDSVAYLNKYFAEAPLLKAQSVVLFAALHGRMDDAYPKFYQVQHEFSRKHLGGPPVRPPRDERCTGVAMGLGKEMDAELIAALYPDFDGEKVRDVAEGVRQTLLEGLKRNTWLSEEARAEAILKVKNASLQLVKPATDKDWAFMEIGELGESDPIENSLALGRAGIAMMLKRLREDRNRSEWFTGPLTVNAFYSAEDNQFTLPQGILQYPFFDAKQSRAENLAAMGMVVGHELGHGVDDEGSKYDSKGKLRRWMTESDLKAFNSRGEKLIKQFDRIGHNGKLTLGENIGDNVGLFFALETAFPRPVTAGAEELRSFFVSYGRLWCNVIRPEAKKVRLKTDPHATPSERINQQVVHRDLFYTAFNCKKGDKMYLPPEDRVQVW